MDQEFRTTLRCLQRAGGSFSQLHLEEFLDHEGLNTLIHHCLVARLRLFGLIFISQPKYLLANLRSSRPDYFSDNNTEQPRIFYYIRADLGTHPVEHALSYQIQFPSSICDLENLPQAVAKRFFEKWQHSTNLAQVRPTNRKFGPSEALFQHPAVLSCNLHTTQQASAGSDGAGTMEYFLVDVCQETPESWENFRKKKLREMGVIPGRKQNIQ